MAQGADRLALAEQKALQRQRSEGIFPLPQLRDLPAWSSGGLTGGQRRRLLREVNGACCASNWMHGEENGPATRPPSVVVREDKNQCLRGDVRQRVILTALRWIDADSAVDENETFAKLLKGRTGYAPDVSSNIGSNENSRVSLPDSVVDAPPLIEMLPAEAQFFVEEFQSRMLLPPEVATVIQQVRGEPGCHHDPRLLRSARSYARLVRQTMKIGLTAVLGVFLVKKKEIAVDSLLIASRRMPCSPLRRLWSCCPETDLRALKSILLASLTMSLLAKTTGSLMLPTVFTSASLW